MDLKKMKVECMLVRNNLPFSNICFGSICFMVWCRSIVLSLLIHIFSYAQVTERPPLGK